MPLWLCWLQINNIDQVGIVWLTLPIGVTLFNKLVLLYIKFKPLIRQRETASSEPLHPSKWNNNRNAERFTFIDPWV